MVPILVVKPARAQSVVAESAFKVSHLASGALWASHHRVGQDFLVRFPGLADFEISASASKVVCWPNPNASESTIEHLYVNQVVPLSLSQQGMLVLHGSAVEVNGVAVAFVGKSGMGKSTLAAKLSMLGMPFLTDDGLAVDLNNGAVRVLPGHDSIRMWADTEREIMLSVGTKAPPVSFTTKSRFLADARLAYRSEPCDLVDVYFLENSGTEVVQISPMRDVAAVMALVNHSFILDTQSQAGLARHLEQLMDLVGRVRMSLLDYPRDFDTLALVGREIADRVAGNSEQVK
jgi:hypothetical protein